MKVYSISEVSKLSGLPTSTIRYYDSCGVLPNLRRDEVGRRIFTQSDIELLAAIRRGLNNGLTISEMRHLYEVVIIQGSYAGGCRLLMDKRQEITGKIQSLQEAQGQLDMLIDEYKKLVDDSAFNALP